MISSLKRVLSIAGLIASALIIFLAVRWVNGKNALISELSTRLATSEQTVEIQKNLYAERTHEIEDLNLVLKNSTLNVVSEAIIKELLEQIEQSRGKILALDALVVKWKKAYEGALQATQTEQPPAEPGAPTRKRVDFTKDFGYIGASGYTLTDPPEGFIKIEQLRPLKLTLAVVKNRDSTWSSYVTSSEDNVALDIALSGVDLSVVRPTFKQRLWLDSGVTFLGKEVASLGLSYRAERWSVGLLCSTTDGNGSGCGVSAGWRLFK